MKRTHRQSSIFVKKWLTSATLLKRTALGVASSLSVVSPALTGIKVESPYNKILSDITDLTLLSLRCDNLNIRNSKIYLIGIMWCSNTASIVLYSIWGVIYFHFQIQQYIHEMWWWVLPLNIQFLANDQKVGNGHFQK